MLAAGAKREGKIVWYTALAGDSYKQLAQSFQAKYGVQVDSYRTPEQRVVFEEWVLTAKFHDYPDGWKALFKEAGYTGDYYWTIIE